MHRTTPPPGRQAPSILEAAFSYHERGWSLIPIKAGSKKPAGTWKRFQTIRATDKKIREWFGASKDNGVAVILGKVSGGTVCRDFDTMESYNTWALAHPDLAATLPTAATGRGRHVYFVADDLGFRDFGDGEYRGDGHYCLLPPSRHPDGAVYKWLIPLPAGPLPRVADVRAAGFLDCTVHATESTETRYVCTLPQTSEYASISPRSSGACVVSCPSLPESPVRCCVGFCVGSASDCASRFKAAS